MLTCSILSSALLHLGALAQTPPSPPTDPPAVVLKSTTRLIQVSVIAQQKGERLHPGDRQPTVSAFAADLEAALAKTNAGAKAGGLLGALKNIVGKRRSE